MTERPDQNARRRSARSRRATAPHNAQDRKGQRTSTLRGWRIKPIRRRPRVKEATKSDERPERDRRRSMAATGKRDVTSEHCRGQEPQERRPVDHDSREATPLVACSMRTVHSTGPAVPTRPRGARKGGRGPVRRSAGRRRSTVARTTHTNVGRRDNRTTRRRPKPTRPQGPPAASANARPTRGRDERPDR